MQSGPERPPGPPIRPARPTDLEAVQTLVADAYVKYVERIGQPPGPMRDDFAARIANGEAWVADAADGIAGLIVLEPEPKALLIDNVAVPPARQGQGIGRALLDFAEARARALGLPRLRLYTHERMAENIALYHALGWQETGRYEQHGYHRVFFEKSL